MTCTDTTVPTRRAAVAPESTAARTAPTSPVTTTVARPDPAFAYCTICTFAAFTMASAASMTGTKPFVSTMPIARCPLAIEYPPVCKGAIHCALACLFYQFSGNIADNACGVRIIRVEMYHELPGLVNANLHVEERNTLWPA